MRYLPPSHMLRRAAHSTATVALLWLMWGAQVIAAPLPAAFRADFELYSGDLQVGETTWTLESIDDDRRLYRSLSNATGLASLFSPRKVLEQSEWREKDGVLLPLSYSYNRSSGSRKRHLEISFDWKQGIASHTIRGDTWHMPVQKGTVDKLSYLLLLMRDLADGKREMHYPIADGGRLKRYHFKVIGEEILETTLGPLQTLKIRRIRNNNKRDTVVWCAIRYGYFPIQIGHREKDGTRVVLRIKSLEGLP